MHGAPPTRPPSWPHGGRRAEAHGWSPCETVLALGPRRGHVGTPSGPADTFAPFVRHGAIDGFTVTPYLIPDRLDGLDGLLVPEPQERGIHRTECTGTTLRENLAPRAPLTHRSAPDGRQAG
ncbi:hypothetical protein [Streptomyces cinereospinus]|uniref:Luciferase-like domain-containing protein n=1 Tax=Streptomyces cinereospinus TaxID=285561 RepID=A0ABV5MX66_9ACTN